MHFEFKKKQRTHRTYKYLREHMSEVRVYKSDTRLLTIKGNVS